MASKNIRYKDQWDIASRSEPGKTHKVSETFGPPSGDGHFECDCKGWIFSGKRRDAVMTSAGLRADCDHIKKVKLALATQVAVPTTPRVVAPAGWDFEIDGFIIRRRALETVDVAPEAPVRSNGNGRVLLEAEVAPILPERMAPVLMAEAPAHVSAPAISLPKVKPEDVMADLVDALTAISQTGKLEDLALAYKLIGMFEKQLAEIKSATLHLAEQAMVDSGESKHATPQGTFGWTSPDPNPGPKVDSKALLAAAASNEILKRAITPYLKASEPTKPQFYLR